MPIYRTPIRVGPNLVPASATSWVIVLAGGCGERLTPFVKQWLGEARPKQYCRFVGAHMMLEHTLARARAVAIDAHVLTVAATDHRPFLAEVGLENDVLYEPRACGTAPGIFLPLAAIVATDPTALVHIMPCDHFIHPRERFVRHLLSAEQIVHAAPDRLVLSTAIPDVPETDFGWIQPGAATLFACGAVLTVAAFHEKPDFVRAAHYLAAGFLWNTMIVSCRVDTLWRLARARLPAMMRCFEGVRNDWFAQRDQAVSDAYSVMAAYDFSRDLLEACATDCLLSPLHGIAWSDWGRPSRIAASVAEFHLLPNYEVALQRLAS